MFGYLLSVHFPFNNGDGIWGKDTNITKVGF